MTLAALRDAVMEGALLRLRPKVMTVSTVIAGLLPIMWSTQTGADVMKPLATPVLGGMVSSLLHVLIVTPVIFFWIRQRQLGLRDETPIQVAAGARDRRLFLAGAVIFVLISFVGWFAWSRFSDRAASVSSQVAGTTVRSVRSGNLDIVLRSPTGALRQGRNTFTIEIRSADGGGLVDAGSVRASANMPMPGMVMSSGMQVKPTATPGRYEGTADFGMAGTWQIAIEWDGAAGRGSVTFEGAVQ